MRRLILNVQRGFVLVITGALLPFTSNLIFAQGTVTNVMSPVVSYQYYDSTTDNATSRTVSLPVSYQFYDSLAESGATSAIMSPVASYQYFDWPNATSVQFLNGATVSYYYQFSGVLGDALLHGQVTDVNGLPLVGATVSAMIYLRSVAQTTTDANGNYQLPSVGPGTYVLSADDTTHQTSTRAFTLTISTTEQDFQLKLLPPTPNTQQVNRQPVLSYTPGPQGATLKIFDGNTFVPITPNNAPQQNLMTIVLTHGWVPTTAAGNPRFMPTGIDSWPLNLAAQLRSHGITAAIANIVGWDWQNAASGLVPPQINTPEQGVALGTDLLAALGPNYSLPIHFLGHSLGTMVNAGAINFLHGDRVLSTFTAVSPTPWPIEGEPLIHVTLFDEAEDATANTTQSQLIFDGNTVGQTIAPTLLSPNNNTSLNWSPPMPLNYTWADNYVSLVGFYQANAANALLPLSRGLLDPTGSHAYPAQWYGDSVLNPTDPNNPLGFQNSFEYEIANELPFSDIPPAELSDAYSQTSSSDPLALSPIPFGLGAAIIDSFGGATSIPVDRISWAYGNTRTAVVTGIDGVVQFSGDVTTDIQDATQETGQLISQGYTYVNNVAAQGAPTVMNLIDSSASLDLHLTTGAGLPGPLVLPNLPHPSGRPVADNTSNAAPMAWIPINFPANATMMAFDFTISGNPVDDALVCGIGTNDLFTLQGEYIPADIISTSTLIDVSTWASSTNELFFGFLGGTSTNATLEIDNIRFFSLSAPSLNIQASHGIVTLSWPLSANNYVLQEANDISATNAWSIVTNVPIIENLQYEFITETTEICTFYRLTQP